MQETIHQYVITTNNHEKNLTEFRKKKDNNLKDELSYKGQARLQWDEMSENDVQTQKTNKLGNVSFIMKMQSATVINQNTAILNTNIIVLDLSSARLSSITDQLNNLPNLQVINLANNLFNEIPSSLFDLPLKQINLNNNLLKSLTLSETWVESLERMDIGKNHIQHLPEQLFQLKRINLLDLRSNDFTKIHVAFLNLEFRLSVLGLDWVKYSFDQYHLARKDVLVGDDLIKFWDVINVLTKDNQRNQDFFIDCHEFILLYDWNNEVLPSSVSAQQPNYSCIHRATSRATSNTALNEINNTHQLQSFKTQGLEDSLNGQNILHSCVKNEDLGVLRTQLKNNYSLANKVDDDGHTPLSLAINEEKYHCAKILINAQVDINQGGGMAASVLNLAVSKMQFYLVRDILNAKANTQIVDKRGNGPLHYLIPLFKRSIQEATRIGNLLLDAGCNPNLRNVNQVTPLHLAIKKSYFSAVKFALATNEMHGYQVFSFKVLSGRDNSFMHLAAKSENIKIILQLYSINPYLLFTYNHDAQRPFDIIQKNYTLSKLLLVLEHIYIKDQVLNKQYTPPEQMLLNQEKSFAQTQFSKKGSWNLNESDDEMKNKNLGLQLFQMQPKLKKSNTNGLIKFQDMRHRRVHTEKVSSEDIKPIVINKSIQQDRNNIKQVELQNKLQKQSNYSKNANKTIHKLLKEMENISFQVDQLKQPQNYQEQQELRCYQKILNYQRQQITFLRSDPLLNLFIINAQELQKFKVDAISVMEDLRTGVDLLDQYEQLQKY